MSQRISHQPASLQSFKQQAENYMLKFEQKMKGCVNYQDNLISSQIQKIKCMVKQNENKIIAQKIHIDDLAEKITSVQVKTESKLTMLSNQLQNFKAYYDQCFKYSISRVNQVSHKLSQVSQEIQKQNQQNQMLPAVQYVKYAHELISNIVINCSLRSSDLKYFINQQLYELEIQISKYTNYLQSIQKYVDQMKIIKFGNESLLDALNNQTKLIQNKNQPSMSDSQLGKRIIGTFQQKFKEIIKRINNQSVEIQMVKLLVNNENNQMLQKDYQKQKKYIEVQQRLKRQLQEKFEQQKVIFNKNLLKKQQTLKRRQQKILQLQSSLHFLLQKQIKMQHQISQIKLHNIQLAKQVKKLNDQLKAKNKDSQASEKSTKQSKKQGFEQKLILLEVQYQNLLDKYHAQQLILKAIQKNPNKSGVISKNTNRQKLSNQNKNVDQYIQFQQMQKNTSKSRQKKNQKNHRITPTKSNIDLKVNNYKNNINNQLNNTKLVKQLQKLTKANLQLSKSNKHLEDQISYLINSKTEQNKQDQQYLDRFQQQIYQNSVQIERLEQENLKLARQNAQLGAENQRIQLQLGKQIQKLQTKCKNLKIIISELQKQNQTLRLNSQQLQAQSCENKSARLSKKGNRSNISISPIAKKTHSSNAQGQQPRNQKIKFRKNSGLDIFLMQLQNAIIQMGLPTPLYIQLDNNGYIRQQKTGNYLVDQNNNPIYLRDIELKAAIENDLIII